MTGKEDGRPIWLARRVSPPSPLHGCPSRSCALGGRGRPSQIKGVYPSSVKGIRELRSPATSSKLGQGPLVGERRVVQLPRLQTHPSKAVIRYVLNGVLGRSLAKSLQVLAGERNYRIPLTEDRYTPSIWDGCPLPPSAPLPQGRTWSAEGYSIIHPRNAFVNEIVGHDFRVITTSTATLRMAGRLACPVA